MKMAVMAITDENRGQATVHFLHAPNLSPPIGIKGDNLRRRWGHPNRHAPLEAEVRLAGGAIV